MNGRVFYGVNSPFNQDRNQNKWRISGFTMGMLLATIHLVRIGETVVVPPEPKVVGLTPASRTMFPGLVD
jgi:hypothetical protein